MWEKRHGREEDRSAPVLSKRFLAPVSIPPPCPTSLLHPRSLLRSHSQVMDPGDLPLIHSDWTERWNDFLGIWWQERGYCTNYGLAPSTPYVLRITTSPPPAGALIYPTFITENPVNYI